MIGPPERSVVFTDRPRVSLFVVVALCVAAIAVVAVIVSLLREDAEVVVAKRDLPAHQRLTSDDLTTRAAPDGNGDFGDAAELEGKLTLVPLDAEEPIEAEEVGPEVKGPIGPVFLELTPEPAPSLDLEAGDRVKLELTPTARGVGATTVPALLLDVPKAEGEEAQAYLVALTEAGRSRLLAVLGRSRLLIRSADR